jgi:hypothetical protein
LQSGRPRTRLRRSKRTRPLPPRARHRNMYAAEMNARRFKDARSHGDLGPPLPDPPPQAQLAARDSLSSLSDQGHLCSRSRRAHSLQPISAGIGNGLLSPVRDPTSAGPPFLAGCCRCFRTVSMLDRAQVSVGEQSLQQENRYIRERRESAYGYARERKSACANSRHDVLARPPRCIAKVFPTIVRRILMPHLDDSASPP